MNGVGPGVSRARFIFVPSPYRRKKTRALWPFAISETDRPQGEGAKKLFRRTNGQVFSPKNLSPGPSANVITQYHVVTFDLTLKFEFRRFNTEIPVPKIKKLYTSITKIKLAVQWTRVCTISIYSIGFALPVDTRNMVIFANKSIPKSTSIRHIDAKVPVSNRISII